MADSQQGARQASARTIAGTTEHYEGDLRAMFEAEATIPAGTTYNGAFLLWLNERNGVTDTNINDAMQRFAAGEGPFNWSSLGPFSGGALSEERLIENGEDLLTESGELRVTEGT